VCDALIDRQIGHIYHVKFNIVNKNMRISYIRIYKYRASFSLTLLYTFDFDYHYSISISIYIFSNYKITEKNYRRISTVFNGSNRLSFLFSG